MTSTAMTGNAIREALEPIRELIELVEEETGANTICADDPDNESVGADASGPLPMTFGHVRRARAAYDAIGSGVKAWRCFHCDDEFTSEHDARLHFGREEGATPACQIKGSEHGLVAALRQAENEASEAWMAIHNETTDAARAYHAQAARHRQQLTTIEQVGYDRGLADAKAHPETLGLSCLSPVAVEEADAKAGEPGDYVLVPREPTAAMLIAANDLLHDHPRETPLNVYRAMLAAAPSTPSPQIGNAGAGPVGEAVAWTENAKALLELNEKGAVSHPVPGLAVSLLQKAIDLLGLYPEFCKALDADATEDEVAALLADRDSQEERIREDEPLPERLRKSYEKGAQDERDRLYKAGLKWPRDVCDFLEIEGAKVRARQRGDAS